MKRDLWRTRYVLPAAAETERNPFLGYFPSRISRYVTLWWWEQGPITKLPRGQVAFWERLNIKAPRNAHPYCYLIDQVKFTSKPHCQGECYGECTHYNFNGLSPHLLGDPRTGIWYEAGLAHIRWARGHWWAVFEGRRNTTLAALWNKAWKNR